jgi:hypothetical protein
MNGMLSSRRWPRRLFFTALLTFSYLSSSKNRRNDKTWTRQPRKKPAASLMTVSGIELFPPAAASERGKILDNASAGTNAG